MWILTSLLLVIGVAGGLQMSLREAVRQGATHRVIIRDYSPTTAIGDLIGEATAIVRGVVTAARPRVVDDQEVVTDLSVRVRDIYRASARTTLASNQTIVVRQPGGTVVIDGKSFTAADPEFSLLTVGDEYVLFLSTAPTGEYIAARGAQSVFHVSEGSVRQLRSAFSEWNDGAAMAVASFIAMVKASK